MADFDELQAVMQRRAEHRLAEARACEAFLQALYHALRTAGGPGQPLHNVSLDMTEDPGARLRPTPAGGFHAAWLRLGLCEVLVRVRRIGGAFQGEFGEQGAFRLETISEDELTALARRLLREVASVYGGHENEQPHLN